MPLTHKAYFRLKWLRFNCKVQLSYKRTCILNAPSALDNVPIMWLFIGVRSISFIRVSGVFIYNQLGSGVSVPGLGLGLVYCNVKPQTRSSTTTGRWVPITARACRQSLFSGDYITEYTIHWFSIRSPWPCPAWCQLVTRSSYRAGTRSRHIMMSVLIPRRSRYTCNRLQIGKCGDYITILCIKLATQMSLFSVQISIPKLCFVYTK